MIEPATRVFQAADGYPLHVTTWSPSGRPRASAIVLHGVQSHAGWYGRLGRTLAESGVEAIFPDRRGSGSNQLDRGHTPSARRLYEDIAELLREVRERSDPRPIALAGISWGGKLAVVAAARTPEFIDGVALICPGLEPRVGVSTGERLRIALAYFTNRRKTFPIPLSDPALFTGSPDGRSFIAGDPLGLRRATAGLLAASTFIDRAVRRALGRVRRPVLLMLAGRDLIVDNERTRRAFDRIPAPEKTLIEYPEAHHTLEFEPDPSQYARDLIGWIDGLPRDP